MDRAKSRQGIQHSPRVATDTDPMVRLGTALTKFTIEGAAPVDVLDAVSLYEAHSGSRKIKEALATTATGQPAISIASGSPGGSSRTRAYAKHYVSKHDFVPPPVIALNMMIAQSQTFTTRPDGSARLCPSPTAVGG